MCRATTNILCIFTAAFAKLTKYIFKKAIIPTIMTKEVFSALIQKDIRELDIIAKGLFETETLSPSILHLASSKAQEIIDNLQHLSTIAIDSKKNIIESDNESDNNSEEIAESISEVVVTEVQTFSQSEQETATIEVEIVEKETIATHTNVNEDNNIRKETINISNQTETKISEFSKLKEDSFATSIANKPITDIKQALSIADKFRFQRELFSNNGQKMNETFQLLNSCKSLQDAENFLATNFNWEMENENVKDFFNHVKRLFI